MNRSMTLASSPYRLTFGGGGTDLPSYASRFGGYALTGAVNWRIHVWLSAAPRLYPGVALDQLTTIALEQLGLPCHQVHAEGDLPAGTGLGSSGAYLVALTLAARAAEGAEPALTEVAHTAYLIESAAAGRPTGTQDFYASACGGFLEHVIGPEGEVRVSPLPVAEQTVTELNERLVLAYTGVRRSSVDRLALQVDRTMADDSATLEALHRVKESAMRARTALVEGRVDDLAGLLHEQWRSKVRRDPASTSPDIEYAYDIARRAGVAGGRLVGAGGGGFLMLLCHPGRQEQVRTAVSSCGMTPMPAGLGAEGAAIHWTRSQI